MDVIYTHFVVCSSVSWNCIYVNNNDSCFVHLSREWFDHVTLNVFIIKIRVNAIVQRAAAGLQAVNYSKGMCIHNIKVLSITTSHIYISTLNGLR